MSSNERLPIELLLQVVNHHYPETSSVARYGWDFSKHELRPIGLGDDLARFVCAELLENFNPEVPAIDQVLLASVVVKRAGDDLGILSVKLEQHAVKLLASQFLQWALRNKRFKLTKHLIRAWMEVQLAYGVDQLTERVVSEVWDIFLVENKQRNADDVKDTVLVSAEMVPALLVMAAKLVEVCPIPEAPVPEKTEAAPVQS